MALAPWRSNLGRALQRDRNKPESRFFQLATLQENGFPANRTVVFRGFLNDTNQLKIITDLRSGKIKQTYHQPYAEACWYFAGTREQFRIAGKLILVDCNCENSKLQQARISTWQEISDNARLQFTWPNPGAERGNQEAFSTIFPDNIFPLANFCLLLLDPIRVEILQLRGNPQNRYLYLRDDVNKFGEISCSSNVADNVCETNWTCTEINP